jgi:hypothetical protein
MEFMQVLGNRRTIRFFEPTKPVEREKIQVILEAANRSSRGINADFCKSIVVYRDEISDSVRQRLKTPTTNVALDLAPVWIFFYGDMKYPGEGKRSLKQLVDLGALPATHGWSHAYVDEVIWGNVIRVFATADAQHVVSFRRCGLSAKRCCTEEGLGASLHAFANVARGAQGPDHWFPMVSSSATPPRTLERAASPASLGPEQLPGTVRRSVPRGSGSTEVTGG